MSREWMRVGTLLGILLACGPAVTRAQSCTTQAKMTVGLRDGLSDAAMSLAEWVKDNNLSQVQANTIAEFAGAASFAPTAALVESTASQVASDELQVTHIYELNATHRQPGDTSAADFSCPMMDMVSETDFAIPGLPPGVYGFAMVEATGDDPWLLAFLLRQDGGVWKLAGFYPRARTAAGHDGLWYWRSARGYAKADELWLAWIFYGEADHLLRPANFVTSSNLERLRAERYRDAPPELLNGIGPYNPLVLKSGSQGGEPTPDRSASVPQITSRITSISAAGSTDGRQLNLIVHVEGDAATNSADAAAESKAAAQALLDEHIELRQAFHDVVVFMDVAGREPLVTEQTISNIP